jgi:hypothetical protein
VSKKPKVIYESEQMYKLLDDGKGGLVLEVVCGTAAMYAVRMSLTDAEKQKYGKEGAAWLDGLAADVVKNEPRYREQGRTIPV